jgi:hypothetical protein
VSSRKSKEKVRCSTRLEVSATFEVRAICSCCETEVDWCKRTIETDASVQMDHIKLWFETGAALTQLRRLVQTSIPTVAYLNTLARPRRRTSRKR